ncbi:MAG: guanylate kinase [Clostridia bacterium]|nr:guanylate kinase [Clostridia bacterium]
MKNRGLLLVVSGPAGAGKGTICGTFMQRHPQVHLSVSATTRAPRAMEQEGIHYYFLQQQQFEQMIAQDAFIEWANFCGNYYGTPRAKVEEKLAAGQDVLLEIEVQGAMQVKKKFPEAVLIFILPPSMEELRSRIIGRGTETMEVIDRRMARAAEEVELAQQYDYFILNDTVEEATDRFESIVQAEKIKVSRNLTLLKEVRGQ